MGFFIKNYSLEYLQNLTQEQALVEFSKGEGINCRQLIANIIVASQSIQWDEPTIVREFWYNPIKPILLRLFPEVGNEYGNAKKYSQFNGILSELRKLHLITYKQLGLIDHSTRREHLQELEGGKCWSNIILFVEKEGAYMHLLPLKKLLNIHLLCGKGWSKTCVAEDFIDGLDISQEYKVFSVTDYDVYGYGIGDEAVEKLSILGLNVKSHLRIAIEPSQLPETVQESQKFPVKMNLNASLAWCEKYGLTGPHTKRYLTKKKNGVEFKELVYEGNKCYGLELEAITRSQSMGPKRFRETVFDALLEHLDEEDRIWEITEPLWGFASHNAFRYYLDDFTLTQYQTYPPKIRGLTMYYESAQYELVKEALRLQKSKAGVEVQDKLWEADEELTLATETRDAEVATSYTRYAVILEQLREKHINPVIENQNADAKAIREKYSEDIFSCEDEVETLEEDLAEIEEPFDQLEAQLDVDYGKSRSLYAQAIRTWVEENIDDYKDKATTTEELSFGLMEGCLKEALGDDESIEDLISKSQDWDKHRVSAYISADMDDNEDIISRITEILEQLVTAAMQ